VAYPGRTTLIAIMCEYSSVDFKVDDLRLFFCEAFDQFVSVSDLLRNLYKLGG